MVFTKANSRIISLSSHLLETQYEIWTTDPDRLHYIVCFNQNMEVVKYERSNFNSGNYLFTTDTK